ncbi:hypothetical protein EW026_g429 [Hermanssonia centrifuga]|uniref:Alcohol dehydrogenase iron-type/glycerol dehydrogenase GldA domain-containing protein n=1 Tax=Hermanssonia centrifuga TaxID=98765 RepID=A0A4S4KZ88_9APHY|nr:hypothetical protein EW026_g429 [Hermanssonia centrifuga]
MRRFATPVDALPVEKEYAFEVAASNLSAKRFYQVGVFTDPNVRNLPPMKMAIASLESQADLPFEVYDRVVTEPTEASWRDAIAWARSHDCSHFLAVGGGSVIDTAKAANLFTAYKDADLFDFINAPVGKGRPIENILRPLIAKLHISAGLDVLFHSLESYTAIPYTERTPRPSNPILRPAYQGSNPVADIFSMWALRTTVEMLPRVAKNQDDYEAMKQMLVALTGPAVFQFTAPSSPSRHREALAIFNRTSLADPSITSIPDSEIGAHLYEAIARFLDGINVPRGLKAIGYGQADIAKLVEGTLPQRRVLDLAPGVGDVVGEDGREHLTQIIERSMEY